MEALLQVEHVSKSFWGVQALDRVGLEVRAGEVHAVTGENGAGKSTLMKIIAGLEQPDAGRVSFRGRRVSMIHQELHAFPDLTVAENIWMGQEPTRFGGWLDKPAMQRDARDLLARMGVSINPASPMRDLSVAEQQCVEIAKALARQADLIVMDEPTSALSAHEAELLFRIIADLRSRGVAILYISHRLQEVFQLADRITVLRDGRHVSTQPAGELDENRLIALMVGRALEPLPARLPPQRGEIILEVKGLTRPGAFRDISFTLRRGEILGFAGLMGAGRTDVAAAIFGLVPATAGTIFVRGHPVRIPSPAHALAHGIAMVTEDRQRYGLVPNMSVKENITLSSLSRYSRGLFLQSRAEEAAADDQIRKLDVRGAGRTQRVKYLSGGNQQKVVLARALLTDPEILILDEPTRGIDIGAKQEIHALIARLAQEGKAILLVSSEMSEILSMSDRILVMREGAVAAELAPPAATPDEILKHAMPN
jgi:inositol transport system ATP-binding protein